MIIQAAILYKKNIYVGKRHHNCIMAAHHATGDKPIIGMQGFIDDAGFFLSRKEAAAVAINCGQIEKLKHDKEELYSEDLY